MSNRRHVSLETGEMLRLDDRRGTEVLVERGEIWLTQEGDVRDRVIIAGGRVRLSRGRRALISAFEPSVLALATPPRAASALQRFGALLAALYAARPRRLALS